MKSQKNFEKKSSCSKKFFWHRKLNDGSPGYWEKYCWVCSLLIRSFKLRLKIFLEAHFLEVLRLFKISKNRCRHILWSIGLKLAHMKDHMPGYIQCEIFFDTTNGWFYRWGLFFPMGHTVYKGVEKQVQFHLLFKRLSFTCMLYIAIASWRPARSTSLPNILYPTAKGHTECYRHFKSKVLAIQNWIWGNIPQGMGNQIV